MDKRYVIKVERDNPRCWVCQTITAGYSGLWFTNEKRARKFTKEEVESEDMKDFLKDKKYKVFEVPADWKYDKQNSLLDFNN